MPSDRDISCWIGNRVEKTTNAYRFEVKLAASGTENFPVREERVFDQSVAISNMTPDLLAT